MTAIAQCFDSADGVPGEMKPNRNHKHVVCRKCSAARRERQLGYRSSWTGCTSCRRVLHWLKSLVKCTKIFLALNVDCILLVQARNSNYPLKYLNILQNMFYLFRFRIYFDVISFNQVLRNRAYTLLCIVYFSIQGIFFAMPKEPEVAISRKQLRAEKGGNPAVLAKSR